MDDLLAAALAQVTVQDETGAAVSFKGLWAERTVVLAFVRHLGCIFCRQQVAGLTTRLPEIERRGASARSASTPFIASSFRYTMIAASFCLSAAKAWPAPTSARRVHGESLVR